LIAYSIGRVSVIDFKIVILGELLKVVVRSKTLVLLTERETKAELMVHNRMFKRYIYIYIYMLLLTWCIRNSVFLYRMSLVTEVESIGETKYPNVQKIVSNF
jgi:hypothetical protein